MTAMREPVLPPIDFDRLRRICGRGPVIDGEVVLPRRQIEQG